MNSLNFETKDGELVWANKTITELRALFGQQPIYVYSKKSIVQRIELLDMKLPKEINLHYAIKANPMSEVVHFIKDKVKGFDVASLAELKLALSTGIDPEKVSLAGPGKSNDELLFAVKAGAVINLESFREIIELDRIFKSTKMVPKVALRVNPNFELKGSGMKMGGGPKPFGIDSELIPEAIKKIQNNNFKFFGFHIYSGSQNLHAQSINESQNKTIEFVLELKKSLNLNIPKINLGGGFGIPYFAEDHPLDLDSVAENLRRIVENEREALKETELVVELGRYLVGEAGIYLCQIVDKKISRGRTFLITNGGLHHHLAATGNFGQIIRRPFPILIGNRMSEHEREEVSIVGPLCTPLDSFADRITLPKAEVGDTVVILQSGAYGFTASPHLFLSQPKVTEYLL